MPKGYDKDTETLVFSMVREGEWLPEWGGGTAMLKTNDPKLAFNHMNRQADYNQFEEGDRVSVRGLAALAPGRPVEVVIRKPDGRTVSVEGRHSMTDEQIGWFRAGSALNALT